MPRDARTLLLLQVVAQVYGARGWQGTGLRGALRGVGPELALWRPGSKRHNIWELVLHAAYWKYIVRRHLRRERTRSFERPGSNWPVAPRVPDPKAWRADVRYLDEQHRMLRDALAGFPAAEFQRRAPESKWTYGEHVWGVAAHDAYHTGQIQLIKRLHADTVE